MSSVKRPRRLWVSVLAWVATAPFVAWALFRLLPWNVHFRWVQLLAFTPYVAVISPVGPAIALLLRRRAALVTGLVATGVLAAIVLPRAIPEGNPSASGPGLRVLSSNLRIGVVPAAALVDLVRRTRPDILTLQELTPSAARGLDTAGMERLLPYKVAFSRDGLGGSGIYSRFPLQADSMIDFGGFQQTAATLAVPLPGGTGGIQVNVVSVHPCAPAYVSTYQCWSAGLDALPLPGGRVRILAGDFNATLDHAPIRRLLAADYRDAADATGSGLLTTWPSIDRDFEGLRVPPVTLDHVLVDPRVAVRSFSAYQLPLTDHRAVFAELILPAS
ncbi:endonuclease/exonuclease/phosphatase family protein [Nonomuraea basaltis]|uniref:endonuclease/exonuclease/phosphatase family protein n=1 Tax=Nonomuraea basaltis TaxID=2495887 RepID=UPI0019802B4E|nr:endonuclease/exonuclease/phosphatase family protein [Nonomuraea basaltis]